MTRRKPSTGEMISTLCFIGVGLWTLAEALISPQPRAAILMLCSGACLAAAARHPIARFLSRRSER
jgi:H+/Cl- antiporter ClcA